MLNKYKIEIKWAIIFLVAGLLWMLLEKSLGLHDENISQHQKFTNYFALQAIAIYIIALYEKRKTDFAGNMKWLDGFKAGLVMTVIISLLSPVNQLITHYVISPSFFQNVIEESIRTGIYTQKQAEEYFSLTSYIFQSMFGALIMGIITSALAALIWMRKANKQN